MAGAAAVIGAMHAIGELGVDLHVVGLVPASDNMIGSRAYRPQDVVTASNGVTIEINSHRRRGAHVAGRRAGLRCALPARRRGGYRHADRGVRRRVGPGWRRGCSAPTTGCGTRSWSPPAPPPKSSGRCPCSPNTKRRSNHRRRTSGTAGEREWGSARRPRSSSILSPIRPGRTWTWPDGGRSQK